MLNSFFLFLLALATIFWVHFCAAISYPFFIFKLPIAIKFQEAMGKGSLWLFDVKLTLKGLENVPPDGTGLVVIANHQSTFDIFVLSSLPLSLRWIAKIQIAYLPFLGWSMKAMGNYFVKRDRSAHDIHVMKQAEGDLLEKGVRIAIFPEGTRSKTEALLPFKKGAFRMAQNAGVSILPVAITGTRDIAPSGKIPKKRGFHVTAHFGKPIPAPQGPLEPFMQTCRLELEKMLAEDQQA